MADAGARTISQAMTERIGTGPNGWTSSGTTPMFVHATYPNDNSTPLWD